MPNININVVDNTTVSYSGREIVVFVPNEDELVLPKELQDKNNFVLLTDSDKLGLFAKAQQTNLTFAYAKAIVDSGLQALIGPSLESIDTTLLLDKNEYNIKFLTSGTKGTIIIDGESVDIDAFKTLLDVAASRRDCTVIADVDAGSLDVLGVYNKINVTSTFTDVTMDNLRWAALYYTQGAYTNNVADIAKLGDLAFLQGYGKQYKIGKQWESIAGVARGTVSIPDDAVVSKYVVDTNIQTTSGISFNAVCDVRPYGPTIWGDRTLFKNSGLKASSFFSIMNMVTDISKRCYAASIENTFESNSDVTWTNYKSRISTLLDEMVGAYKVAAYSIKRVPTDARATIACKIHIIPIEPVEDFDITVILENADATIEMN